MDIKLNDFQKDTLKQIWAEYRDHERNPEDPSKSDVYEMIIESTLPHRDRIFTEVGELATRGLVMWISASPAILRLTPKGREVSKQIFDDMLAKDNVTEDEYFSEGFGLEG